jgi:hypothetical protein
VSLVPHTYSVENQGSDTSVHSTSTETRVFLLAVTVMDFRNFVMLEETFVLVTYWMHGTCRGKVIFWPAKICGFDVTEILFIICVFVCVNVSECGGVCVCV